ncbi:MAG: MBL fold metallo-hydrolase [Bifidobacteriaceae bacterium]|nr:MBL fold metallo-hydrolase [Bifidobacteriaceae bacterium]
MTVEIDVLYNGFPGTASNSFLGWSSITLLRSQDRLCLVDTGAHGARLWLIQALKNRGLECRDIDFVFLTHLHFDHADNVSLFPQAIFYFSKAEWNYANNLNDPVVEEGVLPLLKTFDKVLLEKDGQEIMPGVYSLMTPGHTPGSSSLLVDGLNGKTVITGDAVKNLIELATGNVAMTQSIKTSQKSIKKIKALAKWVVPGHDCLLGIDEGRIFRKGENTITLTLPDGIFIDGKNVVALSLDK